jgi:hypothetical protein
MKNTTKSNIQDFSKSVSANVTRSKFYRPSTHKTTFNAGDLVPVFIDEILPGDTYSMKVQHVARTLTPIVPVMDNLEFELFAFFVPNRLTFDEWKELMGENVDTEWTQGSTPNGVPHYNANYPQAAKKLGDYYGIPVGMNAINHSVNTLPFRGYRMIYNEWFRNENVTAPLPIRTDSAPDSATNSLDMTLIKASKKPDYFTMCLPEPQKGESQIIPINLNQLIPVITDNTAYVNNSGLPIQYRDISTGFNVVNDSTLGTAAVSSVPGGGMSAGAKPTGGTLREVAPSNLWADGTGLTINDTTIADLREAFQIQKLYEKDARGGTRYIEYLKVHFGVDARDYRLQRPEYLGHIKSNVNINQVTQTAETGTTPQGNVAAFSHSQGNDFMFNKSFTEHGFLHILAVARHKKTYQQGLERFWSRKDKLDYYHPVLAHISEQPVYTKEIYADATVAVDEVFGYQEAWSDYRYKPNRVSSQMRSNHANTFEEWHYADDYASKPTLSDAWMQDNSYDNVNRTLAIQTQDQIKLDIRFDLTVIRPMPTNSIPGLIDHF